MQEFQATSAGEQCKGVGKRDCGGEARFQDSHAGSKSRPVDSEEWESRQRE